MKRIVMMAAFAMGLAMFELSPLVAQQGLTGEYYNGRNFNRKVLTRTDAKISFDWRDRSPAPGLGTSQYSIRWTGNLLPPETGTYTFRAKVDDGIRLWIGDTRVIDAWGEHDSERFSGTITLKANQYYPIKVEYFNSIFEGEIQLLWELPSQISVSGRYGPKAKPVEGRYLFGINPPPLAPPAKPAPPAPAPHVKKANPPKPAPKPVAPPKKAETALPPTPASDTIEKYTPKNVLFRQSTSEILPESFPDLDALTAMLQRYPALRLTIEGHTDNLGDRTLNQGLSEDRAATVANYLVQHGVAATRIETKGYGDTRPLYSGSDPAGHARNRRVVFTIR